MLLSQLERRLLKDGYQESHRRRRTCIGAQQDLSKGISAEQEVKGNGHTYWYPPRSQTQTYTTEKT